MVPTLKDKSYEERLAALNLARLIYIAIETRIRGDLIETCEILRYIAVDK